MAFSLKLLICVSREVPLSDEMMFDPFVSARTIYYIRVAHVIRDKGRVLIL